MAYNTHTQKLIEGLRQQLVAYTRQELTDGVTVMVALKSRRHGVRVETGFLTRNELHRPSRKGGFMNGHLVVRPTLPVLDHEDCKLRRKKFPTHQIRAISIEPVMPVRKAIN